MRRLLQTKAPVCLPLQTSRVDPTCLSFIHPLICSCEFCCVSVWQRHHPYRYAKALFRKNTPKRGYVVSIFQACTIWVSAANLSISTPPARHKMRAGRFWFSQKTLHFASQTAQGLQRRGAKYWQKQVLHGQELLSVNVSLV